MRKNAGGRRRVVLVSLLTLLCCDVVRAQYQKQAGGGFEEDEYFRNLQSSGKGVEGRERMDGRLGEVGERGRKWVPLVIGALGGFAVDYIWSGWTMMRIRRQHNKDMKNYQEGWDQERIEVQKLLKLQVDSYQEKLDLVEETTLQLQQAALDAGLDVNVTQEELDYEDFKQPDTNNDNTITKKEFDDYIGLYIKAYPDVDLADMPKFEEFDYDGNGVVTFSEWRQYLQKQREQYTTQPAGKNDTTKKLYDEGSHQTGFGDMYEDVKQKQKKGATKLK